ncbi:MAG: NAD(P)H-dependent oxidoreductase [Glaciecola sp.]
MNKVLINYAHPAPKNSVINNALINAISSLDNVTINDLYSHYPDFMIDIEREQALCESHDVIVFQHPFYWYSTPSIVKEWMDLVLEHGWAYGSKGKALQGKTVLQSITTGGDLDTYSKDGFNQFTIKELTTPFQATMRLCNALYLPPFVISGAHRELPISFIQKHASQYKEVIKALRDEKIDTHKLNGQACLDKSSIEQARCI